MGNNENALDILTFEGAEVRRIWDDRLGWTIPAVDISAAIGLDHKTTQKVLERGKTQFGAFSTVTDITSASSPTGKIKVTCLNRDGLILLINRLTPERITDPDLGEKISRFQVAVAETFGMVLDGTLTPVSITSCETHPAIIEERRRWTEAEGYLGFAAKMAEITGMKVGIATSNALTIIEEQTGLPVTRFAGIIPALPKGEIPGRYTLADIARMTGVATKEALATLYRKGIAFDVRGELALTETGRQYGEEYPYTVVHQNGSKHSGYRVGFSDRVIDVILPRAQPQEPDMATTVRRPGPMTGKHHTEETKRKMSESHKGKVPWNKGIPRTEETKAKISRTCRDRAAERMSLVRVQKTGNLITSSKTGTVGKI